MTSAAPRPGDNASAGALEQCLASASLCVIIASVGRAPILRKTVDRLADQTRPPDLVVVIGHQADDIAGLDQATGRVVTALSAKGSSRQRNHAIDMVAGQFDILVFLDDDIVLADDYLEQAERQLSSRPELVGLTGRMIADGIHGDGFSFEEAVALADQDRRPAAVEEEDREVLYGCNMVFRASAVGSIRFDEDLPLYGWLEDVDFAYLIGTKGKLIKTSLLNSVHLGTKRGRTSGKRLGYSQVVNPVYLRRKRTIPRKLARRLLVQNVVSNLIRSVKPEPLVDRRGRLLGNLLGILDLLRNRAHPRRIEQF